VPSCSNIDIDFLPAGCSDGTAVAAEETALVLLLLALTLMLILVLVTLLEWLRWVA
jgi:hypothetical protein